MIRPCRPGSLRARLFSVLADLSFPATTPELAALAAAGMAHALVRVRLVLVREWERGRVRRFEPRDLPAGGRGRRAVRWALTPLGLAVALAPAGYRAVPLVGTQNAELGTQNSEEAEGGAA